MTIIVASARDRIMIGDTLVTSDGNRYRDYYAPKIFRCRDGSLAGAAGTSDLWPWLRWAIEGFQGTAPDLKAEGWDGLRLTPDGRILYYDACSYPDHIMGDIHAIGAGSQNFMAAMKAGASIHRAVEIVCELQTTCGGELIVLELESPAGKPRRKPAR